MHMLLINIFIYNFNTVFIFFQINKNFTITEETMVSEWSNTLFSLFKDR